MIISGDKHVVDRGQKETAVSNYESTADAAAFAQQVLINSTYNPTMRRDCEDAWHWCAG